MATNEEQARWISAQGWLPQDTLHKALQASAGASPGDLCDFLESHQLLKSAQSRLVRSALSQALSKPSGMTPSVPNLPAVLGSNRAPANALQRGSGSGRLAQVSGQAVALPNQLSARDLQRAIHTDDSGVLKLRRFGKYEILEEISRGPLGVLVRARHTSLDMAAVIRFIVPDDSNNLAHRIHKEGQVLSQLSHPNIVHVSDFGVDNGLVFVTTEYVRGPNFKEWIVQNNIEYERKQREDLSSESPIPDYLEALSKIASALAYCHEQGVIHRNVTPQSIVLDAELKRPVLVNFGLVKRQSSGSDLGSISTVDQSKTAIALGSVHFKSPEQWDSQYGPVTEASDVWGLGMTLFYALSGQLAYPPGIESASPSDLLKYRRSLAKIAPHLPSSLTHLVDQCLQTAPHERPTMRHLSKALAEFASQCQDLAFTQSSEGLSSREVLTYSGVAMIAMTLAFALVVFVLDRSPPEFTKVELPKVTKQDTIALSLTVREGPVSILINGREHQVPKSGTLTVKKALKAGANDFHFRFKDWPALAVIKRVVVLDQSPPEIRIKGLDANNRLTYKSVDSLRGEVVDDSDVELTINEQRVALKDKQFSEPLAGLPERVEWVLKATDIAGNSRSKKISLISERQYKKRMASLGKLAAWDLNSKAVKEAVAKEVAQRLGSNYGYLGLKTYQCADKEHVIARFKHKKTGIVLHLIPGGEFLMGNDDVRTVTEMFDANCQRLYQRSDFQRLPGRHQRRFKKQMLNARKSLAWQTGLEAPQHKVRVPPFLIAATETTQEQWLTVDPILKGTVVKNDPKLPLFHLTWQQVDNWIREADQGLRLPTEAEWEYACRGSSKALFFWGERFNHQYCNTGAERGTKVDPVTQRAKMTNAFGLSDMLGNVMEWCQDDFARSFRDTPRDGRAHEMSPINGKNPPKTIRGGALNGMMEFCRSSSRYYTDRNQHYGPCGFRVVVSVPGWRRSSK